MQHILSHYASFLPSLYRIFNDTFEKITGFITDELYLYELKQKSGDGREPQNIATSLLS